MQPIKVLDLFSGIGGFALAGQMVGGFETVAFCEIDPFAQKVLKKNFPNIPIFSDVRTLTINTLRDAGITQIDCITGGWPCQDISGSNPNGRGLEGERSGLFYEFMRIVRDIRPSYFVLENTSNLLTQHDGRTMGTVLWEISQSGYDASWQTISAASVGAEHLRERIFIVAYANADGDGRERWWKPEEAQGTEANFGQSSSVLLPRLLRSEIWQMPPNNGRASNGLSSRVDRFRGIGNAVVPQCAAIALARVKQLRQQLN